MLKTDIGIIGGGPVGLVALYECKKRNIKATLYEKESQIGGIWNLTSTSSGHKSTVFNTSAHVSSFNLDFPLYKFLERKYSAEIVDYASGEDFNEYLKEFVEHYGLTGMISFSTKIEDIIITRKGQRFTFKTVNVKDNTEQLYSHDYVIVASGRQGKGITPEDPFLSSQLKMNADNIWHTSHWDPLDDHNIARHIMEITPFKVLVVGSGSSATDAIQDTINHSRKMGNYKNLKIMWAPTREPEARSVWLASRYPYKGSKAQLPLDESTNRLSNLVPQWFLNKKISEISEPILLHKKNETLVFDRDRYCICDKDLLEGALQDRTLRIISDPVKKIYRTKSSQVVFETSSSDKTPLDAVIIGSGYRFSEPKINGNYTLQGSYLYRHVIPIDTLYDGRLGFVPTTSILGSTFPLAQMEIKWLLYQWFHENSNLTENLEKMRKKSNNEIFDYSKKRWPGPSFEILAREMNVHPRIWRNLFSFHCRRRHVALACLLGPWSIYQYGTVNETDSEKQKRENEILISTENVYKKCGQSFRLVCFISDMTYYLILVTLILFLYMIFKF